MRHPFVLAARIFTSMDCYLRYEYLQENNPVTKDIAESLTLRSLNVVV